MRYWPVLLLLLAGCASQTRLAVDSLDQRHPGHASDVCRQATQLATMHDDIKLTRTLEQPGRGAGCRWGGGFYLFTSGIKP